MRTKIPPSEALRQEIFRLMSGGFEGEENPLDSFVRLSARLMLQVGMEKEVEEFLGRAYYQRKGMRCEGWRNGYEPRRLKSSEGILPVLVPQVRNTTGPFRSQLLKAMGGSTRALQEMVTRM